MLHRRAQAVFVVFVVLSRAAFEAANLENTTTSHVDDDDESLRIVDSELASPASIADSVHVAANDTWRRPVERVRLFNTMTTSYNWSARFDDRDRDKTLTIVMSYLYRPGFFGSMSIQNGASYLTAAIEDYCRQENNGLEDYYFE